MRFKAGLMQRRFSQKLRFTQDDGSAFPDWDMQELQEVGQRSKAKNTDLELSRVLTNSATMGVLDQGDCFDKNIANVANIGGYYIVREGDLVYNPRISVSAPVGPITPSFLVPTKCVVMRKASVFGSAADLVFWGFQKTSFLSSFKPAR